MFRSLQSWQSRTASWYDSGGKLINRRSNGILKWKSSIHRAKTSDLSLMPKHTFFWSNDLHTTCITFHINPLASCLGCTDCPQRTGKRRGCSHRPAPPNSTPVKRSCDWQPCTLVEPSKVENVAKIRKSWGGFWILSKSTCCAESLKNVPITFSQEEIAVSVQ